MHLDPERAEDGEVEETEQYGRDERTLDELADGSAARNSGDEHADERRPGDPPTPVEDGPIVHEIG